MKDIISNKSMLIGKELYERTLAEAMSYRDYSDEQKNMLHFCKQSICLGIACYLMSRKVEAKVEFSQAKECFKGWLWQRRCY